MIMSVATPERSIFLKQRRLAVFKQGEQIFLDFPTDEPVGVNPNSGDGSLIEQIMGAEPVGVLKGRDDFMVVVESEEQVLSVVPDMMLLGCLSRINRHFHGKRRFRVSVLLSQA